MALLKTSRAPVKTTLLLNAVPALTLSFILPLSVIAQGIPTDCTVSGCLNSGVCTPGGSCDCTGTGYTGQFCEIVDDSTGIINCIPEAMAGLSWEPQPGPAMLTSVVSRRCGGAFNSLRAGSITRTCTNGTWSPPDYSQCLINAESAFLLLWVPLNVTDTMQITSALPALEDELLRLLGLDPLLPLDFVRTVEIGGPMSYHSVTFVLSLPDLQPSTEIQANLSESTVGFGGNVRTLGGLPVAMDAPWGIQGFFEAASCPCRQPADTVFLGLCEEIVPVPACSLTKNNTFQCFFPYFIGDGDDCTVDEDGDGFPNVPLEICTQLNNTNASYCTQDNCPMHYNPTQDVTKCAAPAGFDGCLMEEDEVWEVSWGNTPRGQTDKQRCPMGPGLMTRVCGSDGIWLTAVASECGSYEFAQLEEDINAVLEDDSLDNVLQNTAEILQQIRVLTMPGRISRLPFDLDVTIRLVNAVLEILEEIQEGEIPAIIPDFSVLDILSNVLTATNLNGWRSLQKVAAGTRQLLDISERYGLYVSRTVDDDDNVRRRSNRDNILLGHKNAVPDLDGDQVFPESDDDVNGTFTSIPAQIMIPRSFLREQMRTNRSSVSVSTILYRNLEQVLATRNSTQVASNVISGQVSQRDVLNSPSLQEQPIVIKFVFSVTDNNTNYFCAYWQFSNPVGSGSWQTDGVSMMSQQISSDGQTVTVYCNATHLTSFAVLVDLSGTLNPGDNTTAVDPDELLALQIVSYIGCIISLICLLATIIFFFVMGSELFRKVHYFIHLNLAIVLFLAYLMFVVGIETAKTSRGGCVFVAVWLHYFFLSSFSWMLCEGIMLYLMLVVVFSKLSKRWWFFMIIGYGLPVIPVVITLGARWSYYGVYGSDGSLHYCWLSTEIGVIWAFVGPMLAIIMVNAIFLAIALIKVFKSTHGSVKRQRPMKGIDNKQPTGMDMKEGRTLFVKLFVATLVLLPLLGVTWVLGIFAVNANTTLFAWLFTIFNSLQGLFIFFFHVLRSDKLWNSSKAKSARASLSKRLTNNSLRVKRLNLKKMETTSSILNSDTSNSGKYVSSSTQERADYTSTLPDISEGVEMQKDSDKNERFEVSEVGNDPDGEEKVFDHQENSGSVNNLPLTLNRLV